MWRFVANAATTLHSDVELTLGTLTVPRVDDSLYLLYSPAGWQLIVSRAMGVWGTTDLATTCVVTGEVERAAV